MAVIARHSSPSDAAQFYIVSGIFLALAAVLVALRLYIRCRITRNPWWDDVAAVIALLSQAATQGIIFRRTTGLGTHLSEVSREGFSQFQHVQHPANPVNTTSTNQPPAHNQLGQPVGILSAVVTFFTKLALLLLYLRLFALNRAVKFGIWTGIATCAVFYTASLFLYIFIDRSAQAALNNATGVFGAISDVYIITLPLFAVYRLHLSRWRKGRVAAVFLTGLLAVIMSFLACIYRFKLDLLDTTFSLLRIFIVTAVEVDIGIICCCLPLLPALFKDPKESWLLASLRSLRGRFARGARGEEGVYGTAEKVHQQLTDILLQLAPLKFSSVGSLREDANGNLFVGPYITTNKVDEELNITGLLDFPGTIVPLPSLCSVSIPIICPTTTGAAEEIHAVRPQPSEL
ncbi:hypothetical protein BDW62DRAFT_198185 [Aspergillus aurantiobrunneus]